MSRSIKFSFFLGAIFTLFLVFLSSLKHFPLIAFLGLEALVVLCFVICPLLFRRHEKKEYNRGICPKCGEKLEYFDTASDGSDGYACRNINCHYHVWIGWYDPIEEE